MNFDFEMRATERRRLDPASHAIPLRSPLVSLIFLLVLAVPVCLLVLEALRIVVAQSWGDSLSAETVRGAITLDPANPDLHYQLGKVLLLEAEPGTQAMAEQEFRQATNMNPNSATYWSALGKGCYSSANQSCADAAFRRAQELAPGMPQFAWEAAINDVVSNQPGPAVKQIKKFLRMQPDGWEQAFQLLMRGFGDPNIIWRDLLGSSHDLAAKLQFLDYLADNNKFEPAGIYWSQLAADKTEIPIAITTPYIERLLVAGHYHEAAGVWAYLLGENDPGEKPVSGERNLVFNGGFERDPLNAGFDWRFWQQPYLTTDFADHSAHSGGHAFRTDFTVPRNSEYELAYQLIPVAPGQEYELTAYVKSEAITSDTGPRLRVLDAKCAVCLDAATPGTSGTAGWHQVTTQFTTGAKTDMVRLSLWRPRGRSYPMEISGQVWFDDISLRLISSSTQKTVARGNR